MASLRLPPALVRPVTPADVPSVVALQIASWRAAYAGIIPDDYLRAMSTAEREGRHLERLRRAGPRSAYLLAERAGSVVGMALTGPVRDADLDPEQVGEVQALYAAPDAWSTGVGAALMDSCLDHLRCAGFARVALWVLERNGRARRFYERWGLTTDGARRLEDLGAPVAEVRYLADLGED